MLIISISAWLHDLKLSDAHSDGLAKTLLNVSQAVNTMVNGLGAGGFKDVIYPPIPAQKNLFDKHIYSSKIRQPFYAYGDNIWYILLHRAVSLSELKSGTNHFLAFGPLLHVIAEGFVKQVFFVAEEWPEYLHSALKEVHERGGCSDERCRWASHDYEAHDDTECPLLVNTALEEVEASSFTSLCKLPSPVGRSHTPTRSSESISQLGDVSKEVEGTQSISYSNSVTIQAESRQQTWPPLALDQSTEGGAQHDTTVGVELRHGPEDVSLLSCSPPTHLPQSATLPLPSFEGSNDFSPLADIPSINTSNEVYDPHEGRVSSFENNEPHNGAAPTNVTNGDTTDATSVDTNNAPVDNLV